MFGWDSVENPPVTTPGDFSLLPVCSQSLSW